MHRRQDVQSALERWREAERRVSRSRPSSRERLAADHDVAVWRAAYQLAVAREGGDDADGRGTDPEELPAVAGARPGGR